VRPASSPLRRCVALIALVVAVAAMTCSGCSARTAGPGPAVAAPPPVGSAAAPPVGSADPDYPVVHVVAVEDGYTAGTRMGGVGGRHWTAQLQRDVGDEAGIDTYIRKSRPATGYAATHPGAETFGQQILRRVNAETQLVIIVGGTNDADFLPDLPAAVVRTLDDVRSRAPGAGVIVVGPPWVGAGRPIDAIVAVNSAIRDAAVPWGATFVDALDEDWIAKYPGLLAPDGVHLTDAGNKAMATHLAGPVIAALTGQAIR
jgi:lysophospholipase L1-like esterase